MKDSDESKWYRLVYLARIDDVVYVLHCFTKNTAKTEKRDLATAERRWKQVQQRLREEQKHEKNKPNGPHLTQGSVLDDLGFSPAEALDLKIRADIYGELLDYIRERGFTQQELGALLGIHQPDVSNLLGGRVSKFSVGKLIKFAGKLNLGAQVTITKPKPVRIAKVSASAKRKPVSA